MAEITIIIPGEVVPKQSVRVRAVPYYNESKKKCDAFIKTYQKKEITEYENKVKISALEQMPLTIRGNLLTGALELDVIVITGIPKTMTKADANFIAQGGTIYKTTLPDLTDNLIKGICDGLEKTVYENDGQICKISSQKIYGFEPRAIVTIKQIEYKQHTKTLL